MAVSRGWRRVAAGVACVGWVGVVAAQERVDHHGVSCASAAADAADCARVAQAPAPGSASGAERRPLFAPAPVVRRAPVLDAPSAPVGGTATALGVVAPPVQEEEEEEASAGSGVDARAEGSRDDAAPEALDGVEGEARAARQFAPFPGGAPAAYADIARQMEASIRGYAQQSSESLERIKGAFGSLGLDFADESVRVEARDALNQHLSLIAYYTQALGTLAEATEAEVTLREAQQAGLVSQVEALGQMHGALRDLGASTSDPRGDAYSLVGVDPPQIYLTTAPGTYVLRVRGLAHPVTVERVRLAAAPDVVGSYSLGEGGCAGATLSLGDDCTVQVGFAGTPDRALPPRAVVLLDVFSDASGQRLAQTFQVPVGALPTPPAALQQLQALELRTEEIVASVGPAFEEVDQRLQTVREAAAQAHRTSSTVLQQVEALRQDAHERVDSAMEEQRGALEAWIRDDLDATREALEVDLQEVAEAGVAPLVDRLEAVSERLALLEDELRAGPVGVNVGGPITRATPVPAPAPVPAPVVVQAPPPLPFVERLRILSLSAGEGTLSLLGPQGGGLGTSLRVREGSPLPSPGWRVETIHPGAGRVDLRDPAGRPRSVFLRGWPSAAADLTYVPGPFPAPAGAGSYGGAYSATR